MIRTKQYAMAVFAVALVITVMAFAPKAAQAQSGVVATISESANQFHCVANGVNVTMDGQNLQWLIFVDGYHSNVTYGYIYGPSPYTGPWVDNVLGVDAYSAGPALTGYHTCQFIGYFPDTGVVLWNTSTSYTF